MESDAKILVNLSQGSIVCEKVEIADRAKSRMRGLLGRDSLDPGEAMLLSPAPSIHTAFMRFSIDAVFLDGTLRVKKLVEGLRPWRIASARRSWGVVELAEGEIARRGIGLGDQFGVVEISDELGAVDEKGGWTRFNWTLVPNPAEHDDGRSNGGAALSGAAATFGSELRRDGKRVLVVGNDRRFRSVAAALLTRRGCKVTLGERNASVAELAKRVHAEIVVLDAGVSLTEAAHAAAQIESLEAPVGLVVVGEDVGHGLPTMPVLPKWGSFDGLYNAIEQALPRPPRTAFNGGSN